MSSPPVDTLLTSSPTSMGRGSPVLRRASASPTDINELAARPRLSPTLPRSFDLNDPEVRERQRTMDVDMAMQLSRARRETVSISPGASPYEQTQQSEHTDPSFPSLSAHEQHEVDLARGEHLHQVDHDVGDAPDDVTLHNLRRSSPVDPSLPHLHQTHDPSLLVALHRQNSHPDPEDPSSSLCGLPTYQANVSRANFDFSQMEEFAAQEKVVLGISSSNAAESSSGIAFKLQNAAQSTSQPGGPSDLSIDIPQRIRQRKLSQSNPRPRTHRKGIGGKMALFEGNPGEPHPSLPSRLLGHGPTLSTIQSYEEITPTGDGGYFSASAPSNGRPGGTPSMGILNTGHDRPYRFSFYSNKLSATVHARSLSELPADGQTFEQLFEGISPSPTPDSKSPQQDRPIAAPIPIQAKRNSGLSGVDGFRRGGPGPGGIGGIKGGHEAGLASPALGSTNNLNINANYLHDGGKNMGDQKNGINGGMLGGIGDFEGNTWWLDVQSPTDEEMKMLSKVFCIHPLTTEDIQMEETREKIELFRNYYLVCFRSFDQDPYSPTHLEPLNMYIIVFREGTLSFHFRPTPHPQNVRRRIKQLKDYISVTSDWISYALIDDITDAFGPLIQSIEYEVDSIDELVLILKEAEQSDMLRRIGTCRKKVMGLLRLMGNKADVVKGLAKRCNENWRVAPTSDIGLYLSDIQDHLITMTQNLNHYEKILSRSHSNYLAQISIEMTDANNQINDVLSKLTALGTVLIPMNLVTGLWGMNVHVPGQNVDGYAWFISIIAGLAAFALIGGYSTYKFMIRR